MSRKTLAIATALLALAAPAATHANPRYAAKRVAIARVALGTPHLAGAAAPRARQADDDCPNADLVPAAGNLDLVRAAVICLHNQIRARNGLPLLKGNAKLRRAADGHSADMVQTQYFEHTSPSGSTMVDRILRAGYVRRDRGWLLGENLEWGTGSMATARGAVEAWMDSPGHRANILKRGYRHVGVGISLGVPKGDAAGTTFTVDFGARG